MSKQLQHFSATWCQPCKKMEPVIAKFLEENPDIEYVKYDADQTPEIFAENNVTGVPAFIVTNGDKIVRHQGIATAEKFASLFE